MEYILTLFEDYPGITNIIENYPIIIPLIGSVVIIGTVMGLSNFAILAERKIAGWIQRRPGPNHTSIPYISSIPIIGRILLRLGIFQMVADAGKMFFKEEPIPGHVNKFYFNMAPLLTLIPALTILVVLPVGEYHTGNALEAKPIVISNLDIGMLLIFAISSLGIYGIILGGWASNNKYSFLGCVRGSAQMISYELAMGLSILPVFMWSNSPGSDAGLNLFAVAQSQGNIWLLFWQPLSAFIFMVALFAETNRLPFDMPESETDLVSGFHTEYGDFKFGLYFVAEYGHVIIGSGIFTILFLGGWHLPFIAVDYPAGLLGALISFIVFFAKTIGLVLFFIWMRWTLPRFRYDQVMNMGWKILLPLAIINLIFNAVLIAFIDKY